MPPRTLYLEERKGAKKAIIIGINPGKPKKGEKEEYIKKFENKGKIEYNDLIDYWEKHLKKEKYFEKIRNLLNNIDIRGTLLWSNLCKCQTKSSDKIPSIQNLRYCINKFLKKEIDCLDNKWFLICVGYESFKAISYIYYNKKVLGIYHPTGGGRHFMVYSGKERKIKKIVNTLIKEKKNQAIFINEKILNNI